MTLKYTNNAQSTLAAAVTTSAVSMTLAAGEGQRFPDIGDTQEHWFPLTLIKADGSGFEIVRVIAREGDAITVVRGQENTPVGVAFAAGDIVSLRMTSAAFDEFVKDGDASAVILQGLNVAVQTNVLSTPYALELAGISELTDGLRISFKPVVTNSATSTQIKINDLDEKNLISPHTSSSLLAIGELRTDQFYEIQYVADRGTAGVWLLETPMKQADLNASSISKGVVELYNSNNPADATFDTSSNPVSFSGAPKVFTRVGISKIIEDYAKMKSIADTWKNFGIGSFGGSIVTSGGTFLKGGSFDNWDTFIVPNGEEMRCGNVTIIRASESITISGTVILGQQEKAFYPVAHIGPSGGDTPGAATGGFPDYLPPQQRLFGGNGGNVSSALISAIAEGESLSQFYGGHGRGQMQPGNADSRVRGRGSLILIAPLIQIASTAKFYLPVRLDESSTAINETNGQGTTDANASGGGGGLLIFSCDSLVLNTSAQCKTHDPAAAYETFAVAEAPNIVTSVVEHVGGPQGPQTGKIFRIDTANDNFTLLV